MKKWSLLFLFLALCLFLMGCPSTPSEETEPVTPPVEDGTTPADNATPSDPASKYGGTMKVCLSQGPSTPIGWIAEARGLSFTTMNYCLDTLLREDVHGNITPGLATSYEIDTVSSTITFHLREGVKFHDGSDFNAQAVKWNFDTIKSVPGRMKTWISFEVLDEYIFRIKMTDWQNRYLRSFASIPTHIISPTAFEKHGIDWMRWNMVGTGPWVQKEFIKDVSITFTRNENYWEEGKPYLDGVEILYVSDPFARESLIKKGAVDALSISYADFSMTAGIKEMGYQILSQPTQTTILVPDSANPNSPWSNPLVRMAAEYAIDKDAIAESLGYGYVEPLYQICSSHSRAYDPELEARKYDPAKARELLKQAGYKNGFKTSIIHPSPPLADKNSVAVVQAYLLAVGIEAEINMVEPAKMAQYQTATSWENALLWAGTQEHPNFNASISAFWRVGSVYFASLKRPDGWVEVTTASFTSEEVDPALMRACVDMAYNDAMVIPLSISSTLYAVNPKLHDTGFGERGSNTLANTQNAWFSK